MPKHGLSMNPIRLERDQDDVVDMWMAGLFMVPKRYDEATRTLLLLEDESVVMKFLRNMLKKQYSVIEASSAEQALRLFRELGRRIDLLVADLSLPTSSGIKVALLVRSEIPNLPVILTSGCPVSGWGDPDYADLERLGSNSVAILQKPFQTQELLDTVRKLLGGTPRSFQAASPA
jgi:two-component system cell cycle sensor histidine kinase/response regulator CckA